MVIVMMNGVTVMYLGDDMEGITQWLKNKQVSVQVISQLTPWI